MLEIQNEEEVRRSKALAAKNEMRGKAESDVSGNFSAESSANTPGLVGKGSLGASLTRDATTESSNTHTRRCKGTYFIDTIIIQDYDVRVI